MVDNPATQDIERAGDDAQQLRTLCANRREWEAQSLREAYRLRTPGAGRRQALAVARLVDALDLDAEAVTAALLRVGEGAPAATLQAAELHRRFGSGIARLLAGAARMEGIGSRARAGASTRESLGGSAALRRLLLAIVDDPRVVVVALAEQLHLLRDASALEASERERLARVVREVYAPLASRLGVWQLKWELEDLAMRVLEPGVYREIALKLRERRADRERYIEEVIARLGRALAEAGLRAEVTGRPKHIYSIARKMRRKGLAFEELYDVRAVRILVDEVADCYAALGVVHGLWRSIPDEFDDYIVTPKGNDYQSLHTAVIGPGGRTLEVQIRTHEMHARAELGVAAHWRYKEGGKPAGDRAVEHKIAWLREVLAWKDELVAPGGAPEAEAEQVYALTRDGDVVELPQGATVLDLAYQIHTDLGHRCRGAKVNGSIVSLGYALRTGDRVELLTAREAAPSRDWMSPHHAYLRTNRARAKVRRWFKEQDHDRHLAAGREIYERELRRLGAPRQDLDRLAGRFHLARGEDLLVALGRSEVGPVQLSNTFDLPRPEAAEPAAAPRRARHAPVPRGAVQVEGLGNVLVQLARCCRPLPPDPIAGYLTQGRGVSIHREQCPSFRRLLREHPARRIGVAWNEAEQQHFAVELGVEARDRQGLLRDISAVLSAEKANVVALDLGTDRVQRMARADLTIEVTDGAHLQRVLKRLGQVEAVSEVRRRGV